MLKKVLIGVGVLAVVIAGALFYLNSRNRTVSPPGNVELTNGDLTVSVSYSRPSVRGRLIFGPKEKGALQPYGAYWRLGANEATEITLNKDVSFNGQPLKAGTYMLYAVPEEGRFEIVVNSELGRWGYFEPDHALDIMKTNITAENNSTSVEQYTISLQPIENGINVLFEWADLRWSIPVINQ